MKRLGTMLAGLAALFAATTAQAADVEEIRIDWATYNPVSILLKEKGLLEKEFEADGISIRWVQSAGSNKALEFLNAQSIDFGSTAGSAAFLARINGNPVKSIYVYSKPEWTALVTKGDSDISAVADLKGKTVAVTRGTDPHIFLVRALSDAGLSERDLNLVLLQHADGKTALLRGDVDAWAGLDPLMASAEVEDGAGSSSATPTPIPGASSTRGRISQKSIRRSCSASLPSTSRRGRKLWPTRQICRRCLSPQQACPTR